MCHQASSLSQHWRVGELLIWSNFSDEVIEGLNSVRVEEGRESWIADGQLRRLEGVRYFSEFDSFRDFKPEERRMMEMRYLFLHMQSNDVPLSLQPLSLSFLKLKKQNLEEM